MSLFGAVAYIIFSQLLFFLGTPAGFIPCLACFVPLGVLVGWIVQRGKRHERTGTRLLRMRDHIRAHHHF